MKIIVAVIVVVIVAILLTTLFGVKKDIPKVTDQSLREADVNYNDVKKDIPKITDQSLREADVNYNGVKKDIPKVTDQSLRGVDVNYNGVRDDIEFIIQGYSELNEEQKEAVFEFAKSLQTIVISDNSNREAAHKRAVDVADKQTCLAKKIPNLQYEKYAEEIEYSTINSESRLDAYIAFEKSINGSVFEADSTSPCD